MDLSILELEITGGGPRLKKSSELKREAFHGDGLNSLKEGVFTMSSPPPPSTGKISIISHNLESFSLSCNLTFPFKFFTKF